MFLLNSNQSYLVLQGSRLIKQDKLAHNVSSQSELWEARHAIPGFTKLDKLSQSSMGETLDIREALRGSKEIDQPDKQRTRATRERRQSSEVIQPAQEARGMLGQETLDYPCCTKLGLRHKA